MLFDGSRIDQDFLYSEVLKLRLINVLGIVQRYRNLVDDLVPAFFFDIGTNQSRLIAVHVVLRKDFFDGTDSGLDGGLVVCRAVLA